jgi:hypothetical protein
MSPLQSFSRCFYSLILFVGFLTVPIAARSQDKDKEQIKGVLAETDDAAEVRAEIASVEKLMPQLVDRGGALYFLSTSRQHLGETLEALRLLKECLALREGFDPSGSPSLRVLKGSKEFDDLVVSVHRDYPVVAQAQLAFVTEEKDLVPEGLAYDPRQNVFYLSSLNHRKIVKDQRRRESLGFRTRRTGPPSSRARHSPRSSRRHRVGQFVE